MKIKHIKTRDYYYEVGINGVTEIKPAEKYGHMAKLIYYQVFKGNKLYADVHEFTDVIYDLTQPEGGTND